jgi:hypothetical protein
MDNYAIDLSFNKTLFNGGYKVFQENVTLSIDYIFNKDNVFIILCFLTILILLCYFFFGYNYHSDDLNSSFSNSIDLVFLIILCIVFFTYCLISSHEEKEQLFGKLILSLEKFFKDPKSIIYIVLIIIVLYILIFICSIPMTNITKPVLVLFIEQNLWFLLLLIVIFDLSKYLFNYDMAGILFQKIYMFWKPLPSHSEIKKEEKPADIITPVTNPQKNREVFNISNNLYTYDDAQAICKSYDSRLATYDEVEDSYNNGGEWCNYGWSEAQMVLFPTQKSTWSKLQETKNNKNDCGRPGINGGYISNPSMQYGVNCFGIKPAPKASDLSSMDAKKNRVIPKTKEEIILDAKVKFWQENSDKMLTINSFNNEKWKEL